MQFQQARRAHRAVADAARQAVEPAGDLWAAVAGLGEAAVGSHAEAVLDTAPADHATLLATSDVAAAYAFQMHWESRPGTARLSGVALRDLARAAWARFADRADATQELARGFGWDLSLAWTTLQDVQVGSATLESVQRVAKLAGRMYAALRAASARRIQGLPEEVHSVEMGNKIPRLLPSEHAQLMDPDLELGVMLRLVESRALQYAVRGTGPAGKGPLVLALDESGSMHQHRREWSKAAAIALMRVAFDEKRPVAVVHYSTSIVVRQIEPGDAQGVIAMIRHFLDGGTDIGLALRAAAEQVRALAKKGRHGADVVLVTDGEDGNHRAQLEAIADLRALDARLWTVAIECTIHKGYPLRDEATEYVELGAADMHSDKSVVGLGKAAA